MTISLEAANQISNMTVFGFGVVLVFVGLICIIFICSLVGYLCKNLIKDNDKDAKTDTKVKVPVAADDGIKNKGEFIAAVSAAIAEDLGTDVTGIRVLSVKKL